MKSTIKNGMFDPCQHKSFQNINCTWQQPLNVLMDNLSLCLMDLMFLLAVHFLPNGSYPSSSSLDVFITALLPQVREYLFSITTDGILISIQLAGGPTLQSLCSLYLLGPFLAPTVRGWIVDLEMEIRVQEV